MTPRLFEIVGRTVELRRLWRAEYGGLCPFHVERTPSFTINDRNGSFHCFGCGVHGNAADFERRIRDGVSPRVESGSDKLARLLGLPLQSEADDAPF